MQRKVRVSHTSLAHHELELLLVLLSQNSLDRLVLSITPAAVQIELSTYQRSEHQSKQA